VWAPVGPGRLAGAGWQLLARTVSTRRIMKLGSTGAQGVIVTSSWQSGCCAARYVLTRLRDKGEALGARPRRCRSGEPSGHRRCEPCSGDHPTNRSSGPSKAGGDHRTGYSGPRGGAVDHNADQSTAEEFSLLLRRGGHCPAKRGFSRGARHRAYGPTAWSYIVRAVAIDRSVPDHGQP